jgi:hypothetical protein
MVSSADIRSRIASILATVQVNIASGNASLAAANLLTANSLSKGLPQNDSIFSKFHSIVMQLPPNARATFYKSGRGVRKIGASAGMSMGMNDCPGDLAWGQGYMSDDTSPTLSPMASIANVTATTMVSPDTGTDVPTTVAPAISIPLDQLRASCSIKESLVDTWSGLGIPGKVLLIAGGYLLVSKCLLR